LGVEFDSLSGFAKLEYWGEEIGDSRVRAQDFLTEDTGRGHSLGSEIEG